ncbi:acyl-CoA N-acyltransferase [Cunninghamella echinulata]|nr:acyl-CoA N-acyltransferase [Cunninghamella echinulata]
MTYKVIQAEVQHAKLLTELGRKLFLQTFGDDNPEEDMNDYLESSFQKSIQEEELSNPLFKTLLLYDQEEKAIGYLQLKNETPTTGYEFIGDQQAIELKRIYIDQQSMGKGLGRLLMERAFEEIKKMGKKTVWLGVWEHNMIAQKFYKRYGFEVVGSHIFKVGEKEDCDLIMIKKME